MIKNYKRQFLVYICFMIIIVFVAFFYGFHEENERLGKIEKTCNLRKTEYENGILPEDYFSQIEKVYHNFEPSYLNKLSVIKGLTVSFRVFTIVMLLISVYDYFMYKHKTALVFSVIFGIAFVFCVVHIAYNNMTIGNQMILK